MTQTPFSHDLPDADADYVLRQPELDQFPWVPVLVLASAGFLALAVELGPAGMLTLMAPDLHAGIGGAGALTALYSLGNAALVLPLTALALRFSRRAAVTATISAFVLSNLLVAVSSSLQLALVGRFIGGGAHALLMALTPAVAASLAGPRYTGRALTLVFGANTLGIALGAPVSSYIGDRLGWRAAFLVLAAAMAVAAALVAFTVPLIRTRPEQRVGILTAARMPGVLRVCLAWALVMFAYMAMITYIDPYLESYGAPRWLTAFSLLIFGTGGVLGVCLAGRLATRFPSGALVAGPALIAVAYVLLGVGIGVLPIIVALLGVWGLGFSAVVLVCQQALMLTGHRAVETANAVSVLLSQFGMAAGAAVGGVAVDRFGVRSVPWVGATIVILALLLMVGLPAVLRRSRMEQATSQSAPHTDAASATDGEA